MAYDVKKEQKQFYAPGRKPSRVEVPKMHFAAVSGSGDPNDPDGEYKRAVGLLYGVLYTIRMRAKGCPEFPSYEAFVVPPLEGLWEQLGSQGDGIDLSRKQDLRWTAMIRLPDFVDEEGLARAIEAAQEKKGGDFSLVRWFEYDEGDCVQCMHVGPYDDEPQTMEQLRVYMGEVGLRPNPDRPHHEIYLSDPNRTAPDRLRTVLRIPVLPA